MHYVNPPGFPCVANFPDGFRGFFREPCKNEVPYIAVPQNFPLRDAL